MEWRRPVTRLDHAMNTGRRPQRALPAETQSLTHLETSMNRITTTILTTVLAATAQMATADDSISDSRRHIEVHFADLNVSTPEGVAALYRRLHSAAESVCDEGGMKDLGSVARVNACMRAATSAAVTQIDRPMLTAYYRAKVGGTIAAVRQASR